MCKQPNVLFTIETGTTMQQKKRMLSIAISPKPISATTYLDNSYRILMAKASSRAVSLRLTATSSRAFGSMKLIAMKEVQTAYQKINNAPSP
jgi:hypothetical protein